MSNFPFVSSRILKRNLDHDFNHLVTLLPFTESEQYNKIAKSSFRKTIIIYTASIIEALLFYLLDKQFTDDDLRKFEWKLENKQILYRVDSNHQIIAGDYKNLPKEIQKKKLNLKQICDVLKEKNVLSKKLYDKVDKVRIMRNEQHIGLHDKVKSYSKKKLEKAFSIAREVKEFVKINTE